MKVGSVPFNPVPAASPAATDSAAWHMAWKREMEREAFRQDRAALETASEPAQSGDRSAQGGALPAMAQAPAPIAVRAEPSESATDKPVVVPASSAEAFVRGQTPVTDFPLQGLRSEGTVHAGGLPVPARIGVSPRAAAVSEAPAAAALAWTEAPAWLPRNALVSVQAGRVQVTLRDGDLGTNDAQALAARLRGYLRSLGLELAGLRINGKDIAFGGT